MSMGLEPRISASDLQHGIAALRGNWLWFVIVGAALVILGTVALGSLFIASLAAALVLGWLILFSGIVEAVGAFWCRRWSGFFLNLLTGILAIVVGLMFLTAPAQALLALTILVAAFLLVEGIFKIIAALMYKFSGWGWALLSGAIDVVLGLLIWRGWPETAFWVIGMFVGISMIFRGFNWIALGVALKSLPGRTAPTSANTTATV
jgi:uncharacterized membrane protein HdeD (DUF308 family)